MLRQYTLQEKHVLFQLYSFFSFLISRFLHRGQSFGASHALENVLLQWQCDCWQLSSLGTILPSMPGINPWLWATSSVSMFSLLIFLTSHHYLVSIFSTVNSKAISTILTLGSVQCLADVSDQKKNVGDLYLNFPLGWERDKTTGLVWTALIWFPEREIPFHLMPPYRPKQCSCAVELTLEDTAELQSGASCMGLPVTVLSHCLSPTNQGKLRLLPSTPLWGHYWF